tara:strand:+ start:1507 stop:1725 length:219 start_codon:yes stop_codon:yes gene_type:complete
MQGSLFGLDMIGRATSNQDWEVVASKDQYEIWSFFVGRGSGLRYVQKKVKWIFCQLGLLFHHELKNLHWRKF